MGYPTLLEQFLLASTCWLWFAASIRHSDLKKSLEQQDEEHAKLRKELQEMKQCLNLKK